MKNPILSCKNIGLTLNKVPIIENVSFSLYPANATCSWEKTEPEKQPLQIYLQEFILLNPIPELSASGSGITSALSPGCYQRRKS